MRSRPDLTVFLTPPEPSPGDTLRVRVRLESQSETPCDAIDVTLVGRESRYKRTVTTGKSTVRQYHRRDAVRLGARFDGCVLRPGVWERDVLVQLPPDLPPTYRSSLSTIAYELDVRVHIPWWPDRHETYLVVVRPPAAPPAPPSPRVHTTQAGEHRGGEPVLELSLQASEVLLGDALAGAVAITGLGKRRVRRVEVALCAVETALVRSSAGPAEVNRHTWIIHEGHPEEGAPVPFRIAIPADAPPRFTTPFIQVEHVLEVRAVVAFGFDIILRAPVAVLRPAAPGAAHDPADVPLVGRQRHLAVWREAVDKAKVSGLAGVRFDAERARASFAVGGVQVNVVEEHREELGPCLVASLEWPSLGLDLRVAERRWTDLGKRLPGVDPGLQQRFTVQAREPAQAARLLDAGLRSALAAFDEAGLDDAGAVVLQKGGVYQVRGLERFLARAHHLAAALSRAITDLPPPAALAPALPAFRRFAERHGAALRVGDLSLHAWPLRGLALSLDHRWEGDRPAESRLWAARPPDQDEGDAARWSDALATATGRPAVLADGRAGITLPLVEDPEAAAAAAEALAAAVAKLAGGAGAGPYR